MPSINYEEIYSKFRLKADAYDLLDLREDDVNMFMCEWLHSSIQNLIFIDCLTKLNFTMIFKS